MPDALEHRPPPGDKISHQQVLADELVHHMLLDFKKLGRLGRRQPWNRAAAVIFKPRAGAVVVKHHCRNDRALGHSQRQLATPKRVE